MLRQVFITKEENVIYRQDFGKGLGNDSIGEVFGKIHREAFRVNAETLNANDFFKYRVSYLSAPEKHLLFIFVTDLTDKEENIEKQIKTCKKEFLGMFEIFFEDEEMEFDEETFEIFDPTIESIHKALRPKISLVGFSGVGKTTISRLIQAEDIPMEHVPTITGDIGTIKIGKLHFHLWDFAGQEQFSYLWNDFVQGSDAVLLITDSTIENVDKSRFFIELISKEAPHSQVAVIGNKQDLPDAMPVSEIEKILHNKAYSMIATDPENREKMIQIISDILDISGEISPLLKPLLERDKKIKEAEAAINNGDIKLAAELFDRLADLSMELGDDRLYQDFFEKAQKFRDMVKNMDNPVKKQPSFMKSGSENKSAKSPSPPPVTAPESNAPTMKQPVNAAPPVKQPTVQPQTENVAPPQAGNEQKAQKSQESGAKGEDLSVNELKKQIKMKIVKINQKMLDLETDNIMGDLDDETFQEKTKRMESVKERLQEQLDSL